MGIGLIRSKNGFWPAIPTPAAGKSSKGGRTTPGEWERPTGLRLRFIYRRRGPNLLVAEGRLNSKGRALASKSKTGRGDSADLPAGPANQFGQAAGSGARCRTGAR